MNRTEATKTKAIPTRRYHSPSDKARILRLHLPEGRAISGIREAEGIHPTVFYQWQKTFSEKGSAAFEAGRCGEGRDLHRSPR